MGSCIQYQSDDVLCRWLGPRKLGKEQTRRTGRNSNIDKGKLLFSFFKCVKERKHRLPLELVWPKVNLDLNSPLLFLCLPSVYWPAWGRYEGTLQKSWRVFTTHNCSQQAQNSKQNLQRNAFNLYPHICNIYTRHSLGCIRLLLTVDCFQQMITTHTLLWVRCVEENIRLKLCVCDSLIGKSCLHGKPKAVCYILLERHSNRAFNPST